MFRVIWLQPALDELAAIWHDANSTVRKGITAAVHAIDQELQMDPFRSTESRDEEDRVIHVYPVGAEFQVDLLQRIVWIGHAWRFRRHGE